MNGILLVDKPVGMTSHDVVDRIRRAAGIRRVGHTGTLDPAATGLLVLCLGAATRLSEFLTRLDKVYEGAMQLGVVTNSYDMDGKVVEERPVPPFDPAQIQRVLDQFSGEIMQIPPMVSAVKVGGERLYKKARKGEMIEREPRPVIVSEFRLLGYESPIIDFRVRCSRGTYVRTLCFDVGEELGCGATLKQLRRTSVGAHSVADALPVDAFTGREDVERRLLSLDRALDMPAVFVRSGSRDFVASGAALLRKDLKADCPIEAGWIQVKSESGELLAVGEVQFERGVIRIQPKRVLCAR
jgi:tRNA pseudouridine55 synthase